MCCFVLFLFYSDRVQKATYFFVTFGLTAINKRDIVYIRHTQYTQRNEVNRLEIILSNTSGVPIYQQIVDQVRRMIVTGELQEGDPLPSMRLLAKDLRISLITTKRAYEELEAAGLLVTIGGKGCFVGRVAADKLAEQHRVELEQHLQKAVATAKCGGIGIEQLCETARMLFNE